VLCIDRLQALPIHPTSPSSDVQCSCEWRDGTATTPHHVRERHSTSVFIVGVLPRRWDLSHRRDEPPAVDDAGRVTRPPSECGTCGGQFHAAGDAPHPPGDHGWCRSRRTGPAPGPPARYMRPASPPPATAGTAHPRPRRPQPPPRSSTAHPAPNSTPPALPPTMATGSGFGTWRTASPAEQRFTRRFEGHAELIDHILVSHTLLTPLPRLEVIRQTEPDQLPSITADAAARRTQPASDHADGAPRPPPAVNPAEHSNPTPDGRRRSPHVTAGPSGTRTPAKRCAAEERAVQELFG